MNTLRIEGGRQSGRTFALAASIAAELNIGKPVSLLAWSRIQAQVIVEYLAKMTTATKLKKLKIIYVGNDGSRGMRANATTFVDNADLFPPGFSQEAAPYMTSINRMVYTVETGNIPFWERAEAASD